eukprot:TRINITY_DN6764_c0_g2_i2.p1 TRINITY_DN6764_c0_g2~~TRINITY_DN6764_c0_g2_i2.p1  ORF type:complete len:389 (-),score=53.99 TRINITY_DN6764_c0_g2_i2:1361-2527(-)
MARVRGAPVAYQCFVEPNEGEDDQFKPKCVTGFATGRPVMDAPPGLANMVLDENKNVALRVFILDNSGSTAEPDGHVLRRDPQGTLRSNPSTRWEEICAMAMDQAVWNADVGVRTEFLLLNPPCPNKPQVGRDYAIIDPKSGNVKLQTHVLKEMLEKNGPRGTTPLVRCMQQLRSRLCRDYNDGQQIMLSIVTDGLPTSAQGQSGVHENYAFVNEMRLFASTFNSWMVIRLCTDDDTVVDFYNKIDEEVELPLDILDDLHGEALELKESGNDWFAYTPLIHRLRECGTREKIFDVLDERPLSIVEIAKFLELLFKPVHEPPYPRTPKELYKVAQRICTTAPMVYDGRLERFGPPLNLKRLQKVLGLSTYRRMVALPGRMLKAVRSALT